MRVLRYILVGVLISIMCVTSIGYCKKTAKPKSTKVTETSKPEDTSSPEPSATAGATGTQAKRKVMLNPGHDKVNTGCDVAGVSEHIATYKFAMELQKCFEEAGYEVYCTRSTQEWFGEDFLALITKDFKEEVKKRLVDENKTYTVSGGDFVRKSDDTHFTKERTYQNAARAKYAELKGVDVSISIHFDGSPTGGAFAVYTPKEKGGTQYSADSSLSVEVVKEFNKNAGFASSSHGDSYDEALAETQFTSLPLIYTELSGDSANMKAITSDYPKYAKIYFDAVNRLFDEGKIKSNGVAQPQQPQVQQQQQSTGMSGGTRFDESHYVKEQAPSQESNKVEFADRGTLEQSEIDNLAMLKEERPDYTKKTKSGLSTVIKAIGIVSSMLAILMYALYWFDRSNPLSTYSLLGLVTLGKMRTAQDEVSDEERKEGYVTHGDILKVCLLMFLAGCCLMSNAIYVLADNVMTLIERYILK